MEKEQVANWNRHLKVRKTRTDNFTVVLSPLVGRVLGRYETLLAEAEALMNTPAGRSQGATLKKSKEELRTIAAAMPVANALYLLYLEDDTDEKGSEKAYALRRNKSDYSTLPAALTLAEAKNVAQQAAPLAAKLEAEAGIDTDDLKELDAAIASFANMLAAPKTAIATGKTKRTALGTALKAADRFIDTDLRPAIKTMKGAAAGLRDALLEALRIDDAPGARQDATATPAPGGGSPA